MTELHGCSAKTKELTKSAEALANNSHDTASSDKLRDEFQSSNVLEAMKSMEAIRKCASVNGMHNLEVTQIMGVSNINGTTKYDREAELAATRPPVKEGDSLVYFSNSTLVKVSQERSVTTPATKDKP